MDMNRMTIKLHTSKLAALIGDPNLVIVDTRHDLMNPSVGRDAYAAGHIPGAIYLSIDEDLSAAKTGKNGRHPLPSPEVFAATLGAKGVGNASKVVVYDQGQRDVCRAAVVDAALVGA